MNRFIVVILAFILAGCATTLTEEEAAEACPNGEESCLAEALNKKVEQEIFVREYNRNIDMENWETCMYIYHELGDITYHINHSHDRRRAKRGVNSFDVKSDLTTNKCRMVIQHFLGKDVWAEHY